MTRELWTREVLEPRLTDTSIGFVLRGQLELSWHEGGNESAMAPVLPGDWFGGHTLSSVTAEAPLILRALTLARVLIIGVDRLQGLLAHELAPLREPLYAELAGSLARYWLDAAARLHETRHCGLDERVLGVLDEAATWPSASSHPEGTLVKASRKLLAQRIACSRVSFGRALARLSAAGRVRLDGRRILLLGHQGRGAAD
jgi:CRP-like cAMP-binding protein